MTSETNDLAILVADISNSMGLYEALGDVEAHARIKKCQKTLAKIAKRHHGRLINIVGDKTMCRFPSADDAASAAVEMHKTLRKAAPKVAAESSLSIHIGFEYGAVFGEGEGIYGDAVNGASQMTAAAGNDRIVTSYSTIELLSQDMQERARFLDNARIKGRKDEVQLYEIDWQETSHQ